MTDQTPPEPDDEYPHVKPGQRDIIARYGERFNNTGGNDPLDLLNDLQGPRGERMVSTNIVRYLLAFAVLAQVGIIATLEAGHRLPILPGDLVEPAPHHPNPGLDPREVIAVGRDWLTLDLLGRESERLPLDNYVLYAEREGLL